MSTAVGTDLLYPGVGKVNLLSVYTAVMFQSDVSVSFHLPELSEVVPIFSAGFQDLKGPKDAVRMFVTYSSNTAAFSYTRVGYSLCNWTSHEVPLNREKSINQPLELQHNFVCLAILLPCCLQLPWQKITMRPLGSIVQIDCDQACKP
jgi:hypothetical protein